MNDCDHCDFMVLDVYEGTISCALGRECGEGCDMYEDEDPYESEASWPVWEED